MLTDIGVDTLSVARREFNLRGHIVLTAAERAERANQQRQPKPERGSNKSLSYPCPELLRTPGIPDNRFRAFDLPSRHEDLLFYPDGRVEPFPEPSSSPPTAR